MGKCIERFPTIWPHKGPRERKEKGMGYKKISHKSKEEGKIKRCSECRKCYIAELGDETNTCPSCIEHLLQPCPPLKEVG